MARPMAGKSLTAALSAPNLPRISPNRAFRAMLELFGLAANRCGSARYGAQGPERASFAERDRACRVVTLCQVWPQDQSPVVAELLDQRFLEPEQ